MHKPQRFWIPHLVTGYKEGRYEGSNYQLWKLPHLGRGKLHRAPGYTDLKGLPGNYLQDTWVAGRSWKVTFKLILSSTCPPSSKEYSNNSVYYYLWSVYHLPNTELNTLWNYLCQPSWLPGFEVSLPPSVDEVIEGFRFKWLVWGSTANKGQIKISSFCPVLMLTLKTSTWHSLLPRLKLCLCDCCQNNKAIQRRKNKPVQFVTGDNLTTKR